MAENADPSSVRVVCRFRPQNQKEIENKGEMIAKIDRAANSVYLESSRDTPHKFCFDDILTEESSQQTVFERTALPVAKSVLQGYNGTIFAYGQTSSGKTFTMEGRIEDPELMGIAPRIIHTLFDGVASAPEHIEFSVKVSHMELYMEKIHDLLDPSKNNLQIREEKSRGIWVAGLTEHYVSSATDVLTWMKFGLKNRAKAATGMNADSSRSHSLLSLTVEQKNLNDLRVKVGKLFLVDLAGSEKISKSLVEGIHLDEVRAINTSLHVLGKVIHALTDPKMTHIPYRDSKLTRILQESLGGNAKTTLIICCSPSSYNLPETMSTLRFGERAKSIKNKPKVNEEKSVAELKLIINDKDKEIAKLKQIISGLRNEIGLLKQGISVPSSSSESNGENGNEQIGELMSSKIANDDPILETQRQEQIEFLQDALIQLELKYSELETERKDLKAMVDRLLDELSNAEANNEEQKEYIDMLEQKVGELCTELEEAQYRPETKDDGVQAEEEHVDLFDKFMQTDPVIIPKSNTDIQTIPMHMFLESSSTQSEILAKAETETQTVIKTRDSFAEAKPSYREVGEMAETLKPSPPKLDAETNTNPVQQMIGQPQERRVIRENSESGTSTESPSEPKSYEETHDVRLDYVDNMDIVYISETERAEFRNFVVHKSKALLLRDACVGADFAYFQDEGEMEDEQSSNVETNEEICIDVTETHIEPIEEQNKSDGGASSTNTTRGFYEHRVERANSMGAQHLNLSLDTKTQSGIPQSLPSLGNIEQSPSRRLSFTTSDGALAVTPRKMNLGRATMVVSVETQTQQPRAPVLSSVVASFSLNPVDKVYQNAEIQTRSSLALLSDNDVQTDDMTLEKPTASDAATNTVTKPTKDQYSEVELSVTNPKTNEDVQVNPALLGILKDFQQQTNILVKSSLGSQTENARVVESYSQTPKPGFKDAEVECHIFDIRRRFSTASPKIPHYPVGTESPTSFSHDSRQVEEFSSSTPDYLNTPTTDRHSETQSLDQATHPSEAQSAIAYNFEEDDDEPMTSPEVLNKRLNDLENEVSNLSFAPAQESIEQVLEIITSPALLQSFSETANTGELEKLREHAFLLQNTLAALSQKHDEISRAYRNIQFDYDIRMGILERRNQKIRELEGELKKDQSKIAEEKAAHDKAMKMKQKELAASEEQLRLMKIMMASNSQVYSSVSTVRPMKTVVSRGGSSSMPPTSPPQSTHNTGTFTPVRKKSIFSRIWSHEDDEPQDPNSPASSESNTQAPQQLEPVNKGRKK